jgi:hypothetical protein
VPENHAVPEPAAHNANDQPSGENDGGMIHPGPWSDVVTQPSDVERDCAGPEQKERDADDQVECAMDETSHAAIVSGTADGGKWRLLDFAETRSS